MSPQLFRRKTYTVEAMQYVEGNGPEVAEWCGGIFEESALTGEYVEIPGHAGATLAVPGDYVVRGVTDDFYPIHPWHFEAGYESINRKH